MSKSVDPDETAHYEPSHLDLRCLQKPIIIAYVNERVKNFNFNFTCSFGITGLLDNVYQDCVLCIKNKIMHTLKNTSINLSCWEKDKLKEGQ